MSYIDRSNMVVLSGIVGACATTLGLVVCGVLVSLGFYAAANVALVVFGGVFILSLLSLIIFVVLQICRL